MLPIPLLLVLGTKVDCTPCSLGKLGVAGFAKFEGCDTTQAQILISLIDDPPDEGCEPGTSFFKQHEDAIAQCSDLGTRALKTSQCLLHKGGKGWVVALTTALSYAAVLPLAIAARPSLAIKCD